MGGRVLTRHAVLGVATKLILRAPDVQLGQLLLHEPGDLVHAQRVRVVDSFDAERPCDLEGRELDGALLGGLDACRLFFVLQLLESVP